MGHYGPGEGHDVNRLHKLQDAGALATLTGMLILGLHQFYLWQMAALLTIAGSNRGTKDFAGVRSAIDRLGDAMIWPALGLAFLAIILVACMAMSGNPKAGTWAGGTTVGVILLVLAPGIFA